MADLLIKGMEMPKEGTITLEIRHDGAVDFIGNMGSNLGRLVDVKAIALQEHGRLIDADECGKVLLDKYTEGLDKWDDFYRAGYRYALKYFSQAPTILEASK